MMKVVRYLAGGVVAWLVFPVETLVTYAVLFVAASLTGSDLGSPLAGPIFSLVAVAVGTAVVPLALCPAVFAADRLLRDRGGWSLRYLAALLATTLLFAGYTLLVGLIVGQSDRLSEALPTGVLTTWAAMLLALSVLPLLAFCAVVAGLRLFSDIPQRFLAKSRRQDPAPGILDIRG